MKGIIENGGLVNTYKSHHDYTRAFSFFNKILWVISDSIDKEELVVNIQILFARRLPYLLSGEKQSFSWEIDSEDENYLYIRQIGKKEVLIKVELQ